MDDEKSQLPIGGQGNVIWKSRNLIILWETSMSTVALIYQTSSLKTLSINARIGTPYIDLPAMQAAQGFREVVLICWEALVSQVV